MEQMLWVFYEDLDRNTDMYADHPLVGQEDETVTDYVNWNFNRPINMMVAGLKDIAEGGGE